MQGVEFTMKPTVRDFSKAAYARLKFNRLFHIYACLTGTIVLVSIIWYNYGPSLGHDVVDGVGFCAFLALCVPFLYIHGRARNIFKRQRPRIEERTYQVRKEGFGFTSTTMRLYLSWELISSIYETKNFILIKVGGQAFTIFKNLIPDEVVTQIRKILDEAQAQNKRMLRNV